MSAGISNLVYHGNVFVSLSQFKKPFSVGEILHFFQSSFFYLFTSDAHSIQSECKFSQQTQLWVCKSCPLRNWFKRSWHFTHLVFTKLVAAQSSNIACTSTQLISVLKMHLCLRKGLYSSQAICWNVRGHSFERKQ